MSSSRSYFTPPYDFISGITNAQQAVVSFLNVHAFIPGEVVSFRVSHPYGMIQMNNVQARVLSATSMTVTVDVDSTDFTPFTVPSSPGSYPAMAVPVGSGIIPDPLDTSKALGVPKITLSDAFDNVPVT